MLAANVWHWWIGIALTGVSVAAVAALVGGYLKSVSSKQYPAGKQRKRSDL